jgi:hypothetical protein
VYYIRPTHDKRFISEQALAGQTDVLDFQHRSLRDLDVSLLTKMPNLRVINLSHNALHQLPIEIGQMTRLEQLIVSHNALSSLPDEIGQATNLQVLDLSRNAFNTIDRVVGQLSQLRQLLLADNTYLADLPWNELCKLRRLELVDVSGAEMRGMSLDRSRMKKRSGKDAENVTHVRRRRRRTRRIWTGRGSLVCGTRATSGSSSRIHCDWMDVCNSAVVMDIARRCSIRHELDEEPLIAVAMDI